MWGYSLVIELSTADRKVSGSIPYVPCLLQISVLRFDVKYFDVVTCLSKPK